MGSRKLFVDAVPFFDEHLSGVGTVTYHLVEELARDAAFIATHEIRLVAPAWLTHRLARRNFPPTVAVQPIPLPGGVLGQFLRHHLLPPMDLFLGRGAYLFPNFRNWPLLFSPSLTWIYDWLPQRTWGASGSPRRPSRARKTSNCRPLVNSPG